MFLSTVSNSNLEIMLAFYVGIIIAGILTVLAIILYLYWIVLRTDKFNKYNERYYRKLYERNRREKNK